MREDGQLLPAGLRVPQLWGLTGNVRDFEFPSRGNPANRTHKSFSTHHTQALIGATLASYDEEFEEP